MVFIALLVFGIGVMAQDAPKKKKKAATASQAKAHQKPTKDQIRKFNELQKKQQP